MAKTTTKNTTPAEKRADAARQARAEAEALHNTELKNLAAAEAKQEEINRQVAMGKAEANALTVAADEVRAARLRVDYTRQELEVAQNAETTADDALNVERLNGAMTGTVTARELADTITQVVAPAVADVTRKANARNDAIRQAAVYAKKAGLIEGEVDPFVSVYLSPHPQEGATPQGTLYLHGEPVLLANTEALIDRAVKVGTAQAMRDAGFPVEIPAVAPERKTGKLTGTDEARAFSAALAELARTYVPVASVEVIEDGTSASTPELSHDEVIVRVGRIAVTDERLYWKGRGLLAVYHRDTSMMPGEHFAGMKDKNDSHTGPAPRRIQRLRTDHGNLVEMTLYWKRVVSPDGVVIDYADVSARFFPAEA